MNKIEKEQGRRPLYRRIYQYSKVYWQRILLAIMASIVVSLTDVSLAKLVQPLVDKIIVGNRADLVYLVPLAVVLLSCLKGAGRYVQDYFIRTAGQLVVQDVRKDLFGHAAGLSMRYHSNSSTGTIVSRILNDVNEMQVAVSEVVVDLLRESAALIGLTCLVFYNDWRLASVAFVVIPLSVGPASVIGKKIKKNSTRSQEAMARLTHVVSETFSGIKVVKSFGTEKIEQERFAAENRRFYQFIRRVLKYQTATSPMIEMISAIGAGGVLWYGIQRVMSGAMTQGELFSFITAMMMMYTPVKRLIRVNNKIQRSAGAAVRIFEFLDIPAEIADRDGASVLGRCSGRVTFDRVTFRYEDRDVLREFSLDVAPGEVVALVGPSGAGKSTVVGLTCRFYDPQGGAVLLDGHDVSGITLESLRQNLAIVDQDTFLFNATVHENIAYGMHDVPREAVEEAARMAYAESFILELPSGYDTMIGERGVRLSGGQKQRLCIARAILRNAPVLILDEATSALDTESETIVQAALNNLMQNRTTLVIAHRLSTVMNADRIVVLDKGQIAEQGRHEELLARNGLYQKLYSMQFS